MAILAYVDERERLSYLQSADLSAYGAEHSPERIAQQVEITRKNGFAVNPGMIVQGSWGIGAAVFDPQGAPRWALSLTGIESRLCPPRQNDLGALLLREAHLLSRRVRDGGQTSRVR